MISTLISSMNIAARICMARTNLVLKSAYLFRQLKIVTKLGQCGRASESLMIPWLDVAMVLQTSSARASLYFVEGRPGPLIVTRAGSSTLNGGRFCLRRSSRTPTCGRDCSATEAVQLARLVVGGSSRPPPLMRCWHQFSGSPLIVSPRLTNRPLRAAG